MKKYNIVTIGGGTGSFVLLSGLKKYPVNLSAIASMADDGGSTGILRDELGVLPPGDVRQCLIAISESSGTLRELMNYRFDKGGLKGHNFGNLFLSALEKIKGNFSSGVEEAAKLLNVRGEVLPVTNDDMRIEIKLKNGKILKGENELDHNPKIQKIGIDRVYSRSGAKAFKKAIQRVRNADLVVIGPGDLYASIIPNFLAEGFGDAINETEGKIVLISNLTNKKGLTGGYSVDDYVKAIERYIGKNRINFVVYNSRKPSASLIKKYEKKEGKGALVASGSRKEGNYQIIRADLLQTERQRADKNDIISHTRAFIRHDSSKLAKIIFKLAKKRY